MLAINVQFNPRLYILEFRIECPKIDKNRKAESTASDTALVDTDKRLVNLPLRRLLLECLLAGVSESSSVETSDLKPKISKFSISTLIVNNLYIQVMNNINKKTTNLFNYRSQ